MAYLFSEIIGSLIIVAIISFILGWGLRGLKERVGRRSSSILLNQRDDADEDA